MCFIHSLYWVLGFSSNYVSAAIRDFAINKAGNVLPDLYWWIVCFFNQKLTSMFLVTCMSRNLC